MPHRATNAFITFTLFLDKLLVTISYTVYYISMFLVNHKFRSWLMKKAWFLIAQQSKTPKIFN